MVLKVILGVILVLVLAIVGLAVAVSMQGEGLKVSRSITMNAPPEKPYEQVNEFQKWAAWSPWAKMDPRMQLSLGGPPAGVGSTYAWAGNDEVGEGKMTIMESQRAKHVKIDLQFIKPFESANISEFTFVPERNATNVTWTMSSKKNFVMKAMCLVMDMDAMIGTDFEKGLASMKAIVEAPPAN